MAVTRLWLRQRIDARLGDLIKCTVTGSGSTTQFADYLRARLPSGSLVGRLAYVASATNGANTGQTRYVAGNDQTTYTITLDPALPAALAVGDVIELSRMNDMGPTPDEINDAINEAIESVRDSVYTAEFSTPEVFAYTTPMVTAPEDWHILAGIDWQDQTADEDELVYGWKKVHTRDYAIDRASRTVTLKNRARTYANTRYVRLRGYKKVELLTADSQETEVHPEWLIHQAASIVAFNVAMRQDDAAKDRWERRSIDLQKIADMRRPHVPTRITGQYAVLEPA